MIDLHNRQLIHWGSSTRFPSVASGISGVNVVQAPCSAFARLLADYPEITDTALASSTTCQGVECYINTTGPPVRTAPRRLSPDRLKVAKKYFDVMCTAGICRRSDSPWSSGLHMVPKKDWTSRPCRDYRRLNERTLHDAYPIPHIHDFAAGLSGCTIFSKIDIVKGYHQIHVLAEDVPKTAIAMPFVLFEFTRMPFGADFSASYGQRHGTAEWSVCVFRQRAGRLSVKSAAWARSVAAVGRLTMFWPGAKRRQVLIRRAWVGFLGHRVSGRGISPLPWKVEAVLGFERPHTVRLLQCFLRLVNFYRRFLPNIAATMRPLTDALAGAPRQLEWSEAMMSAFQQMKQCLAAATLLVHPVADAELRVNTDASSKAIAGAIHQVVQGQLQPLVFFSCRTSSAWSRYSAYDLELLAVYATIVKFRHVLEGCRFCIYTDQKPLTSSCALSIDLLGAICDFCAPSIDLLAPKFFFQAGPLYRNHPWQGTCPRYHLRTFPRVLDLFNKLCGSKFQLISYRWHCYQSLGEELSSVWSKTLW